MPPCLFPKSCCPAIFIPPAVLRPPRHHVGFGDRGRLPGCCPLLKALRTTSRLAPLRLSPSSITTDTTGATSAYALGCTWGFVATDSDTSLTRRGVGSMNRPL